jgi:Cytochrome c
MPCANCHGADGRGRSEGGVTSPDITHAALTTPYSVTAPSGRQHGPYTDARLKRAIAMGIDSSGHHLLPIMPRYRLSIDDMNALLAYLNVVGEPEAPGVTATSVRVGVLQSSPEIRAVLTDYVAKHDAVYGRKVELVFGGSDGTPTERAAAMRAFVEKETPFALIASVTEGADAELADAAEAERIPLLATISTHPRSSDAPNRWLRDLVAGVAEQRRALARVAPPDALQVPSSLLIPALLDKRPLYVAFPLDPRPPTRHPAHAAALASAALFYAALERVGNDPTREKLLDAIDTFNHLETGFVPPLTYAATRHLGSTGSFVVNLSEKGAPVVWVDP